MKFVKFKLWVDKYIKNLKEKTYFKKKYLRHILFESQISLTQNQSWQQKLFYNISCFIKNSNTLIDQYLLKSGCYN